MFSINGIEFYQTRYFQDIVEEYKAKSIAEGEASMLKRRLTKRFGLLPLEIETKIANASSIQIENWFDLELVAKTLDDIFRD